MLDTPYKHPVAFGLLNSAISVRNGVIEYRKAKSPKVHISTVTLNHSLIFSEVITFVQNRQCTMWMS